MQTTPTMQRVIEALAQQHGLTLNAWGGVLRLELGASFMPLVIESLMPGIVTVTHYYRRGGDPCPDPDVEFRITPEGWVPLAMQDDWGYRRPEPGSVQHSSLVSFCEVWAANLEAQGWLDRARRVDDDGAALAAA